MNRKRIELNNSNTIIILDINTGVYYYGYNDYCKTHGLTTSTLRYKFKKNKLPNLLKV